MKKQLNCMISFQNPVAGPDLDAVSEDGSWVPDSNYSDIEDGVADSDQHDQAEAASTSHNLNSQLSPELKLLTPDNVSADSASSVTRTEPKVTSISFLIRRT